MEALSGVAQKIPGGLAQSARRHLHSLVVVPYPEGQDPDRGLLASARKPAGMAAGPQGKEHRAAEKKVRKSGHFTAGRRPPGSCGIKGRSEGSSNYRQAAAAEWAL